MRRVTSRTVVQSFPNKKKRVVHVEVRSAGNLSVTPPGTRKKLRIAKKKKHPRVGAEARKKITAAKSPAPKKVRAKVVPDTPRLPVQGKAIRVKWLNRKIRIRDTGLGRAGLPEEEDVDAPVRRSLSTAASRYTELLKRIR